MKTNLIKQEFIIKSLQSYFEDSGNCGYDETSGGCAYETCDGKKCVVGQYLNTDIYKHSCKLFKDIASEYDDFNEIFVDEAKHMLSVKEWTLMQCIHDDLAKYDFEDISEYLAELASMTDTNLSKLSQMLQITKAKYDNQSE